MSAQDGFPTRGDLAREQLRRRGLPYFGDVATQVSERLEGLPGDARRAFALVCAELAMAWHAALPDADQRAFTLGWRPVLETIRAGLIEDAPDARRRVAAALEAARSGPPGESSERVWLDDADEDAAAAAIGAAECYLDGSVGGAVLAAGRSVDIRFHAADQALGLDHDAFDWDPAADPPSPLARENMHPAVLDELRRQLADLDELSRSSAVAFLVRRPVSTASTPDGPDQPGRIV